MEERILLLNRIRGIANYQFDMNIGRRFFPKEVEIVLSKRTGRIRHVYLSGALIVTLRPTDGLFSLTIDGARRLSALTKPPSFRVVLRGDVEEFARKGENVFAKHVVDADPKIRPEEEAIIADAEGRVLAVGRALLAGREMLSFKRGVAVKVRRGAEEVKG